MVETNGTIEEEEDEEAAGFADEAGPINENLFLDEDLDGLDDELNDLDIWNPILLFHSFDDETNFWNWK